MKRILALTATAATSLGVLAGAPAQADPGASSAAVLSVGLSTTALVVDGDAGCADRVTTTIKVYDPDLQAIGDDIETLMYDGGGQAIRPDADARLVGRAGSTATFTVPLTICPSVERPGRYRVVVEFTAWDGDIENVSGEEAYFTVRRPTSLSYNASPEPVKKGDKLTHKGQLKFDRYARGKYYGAKSVAVKLYFRKDGAAAYSYQGTATTDAKGRYAKKIKAWHSGVWKAVYAGTGTRQAQTRWDRVDVKR